MLKTKNLPKNWDSKFEKKEKSPNLSKNLKLILIIPTLNT